MKLAIEQAKIADENGDVPIGAVIVYKDRIIAKAYNQREQLQDPTAHAEIVALTQAAEFVGSWRLEGCTMYVTLEPCCMCAGALVLSRIKRVIYGVQDLKTGAHSSLFNLLNDPRLNHRIEVLPGILNVECRRIMGEFFAEVRRNN